MTTRVLTVKWFVLLALLAPGVSHAMPPLSREWRGTVTAVDAAARELTITDAQRRPLALRWTGRTRFVVGAQFATADALRRGATVEVRYRSPFFGGPYASQIVLLSSTPQTKPNKP